MDGEGYMRGGGGQFWPHELRWLERPAPLIFWWLRSINSNGHHKLWGGLRTKIAEIDVELIGIVFSYNFWFATTLSLKHFGESWYPARKIGGIPPLWAGDPLRYKSQCFIVCIAQPVLHLLSNLRPMWNRAIVIGEDRSCQFNLIENMSECVCPSCFFVER